MANGEELELLMEYVDGILGCFSAVVMLCVCVCVSRGRFSDP